jgi:Fic family protein
MTFNPVFTITPKSASALMKIEALRENIKKLPITPSVMKHLRDSARLQSVHYSTQIEGNRLSGEEVERIIHHREHFVGRERDELEIKGYYLALEWLEKNVRKPITEKTVMTLHALATGGGKVKVKLTPYRDGQNVIRDSAAGQIVYMPPEMKDVPILMKDFIEWIESEKDEVPCPIIAAMAHYQFVTIHPYYDGNGRTARLLTTLVLYQGGYDLKGLYSLEEYYAGNLRAYYDAISRGNHHNYYFGRAEADVTPWIEYFVLGMLNSFENVQNRALEAQSRGEVDKSASLRYLTPKQRKVLTLFEEQATITSKEVGDLFGFSTRSARLLCKTLIKEGFLEIKSHADKTRSYRLAPQFEKLIG